MKDFILGCNYWASNAGTEMWTNWDEGAVVKDFETLSKHGIEYLRVFPNWRDFQPVIPLYFGNTVREYRLQGDVIPQNQYYLDENMLARFDTFCEIAQRFGMKLIVGLITGWMSGRLFVPPALFDKNPYTDPTALMFEQLFIKGFIERFKNKEAIYAWDLGNECNAMWPNNERNAAFNWSLTVSNCIRACDSVRPVVSGMHSLGVEGVWTIQDQAMCNDILTTHPYPFWIRHCDKDRVASMRTLLHATCETKYYGDVGNKPCLVEETGTMGPMVCDDERAADFARVNLYSNWANGAAGMMWWCAHEQLHLNTPPYTWNMCETELGMTDKDGLPKPVLEEFGKFAGWMREANLTLPPALEDGVCILSKSQDHWGIAYMTCILAKQAGVNLRFAYCEQDLPDSNVYLLPSIKDILVMSKERYTALKQKVKEGARLYISNDNGILSEFNDLTGLIVRDSQLLYEEGDFELNGKSIKFAREKKYIIEANGAEILCSDNNMPIFTVNAYGAGRVYYLNFPLEKSLPGESEAFEGDQYEIYKEVFSGLTDRHIVTCADKHVGVTQHFGESSGYAVLINYSDRAVGTNLKINDSYKLKKVIKGDLGRIEPFGTLILQFEIK